jgi:hypothetical protein
VKACCCSATRLASAHRRGSTRTPRRLRPLRSDGGGSRSARCASAHLLQLILEGMNARVAMFTLGGAGPLTDAGPRLASVILSPSPTRHLYDAVGTPGDAGINAARPRERAARRWCSVPVALRPVPGGSRAAGSAGGVFGSRRVRRGRLTSRAQQVRVRPLGSSTSPLITVGSVDVGDVRQSPAAVLPRSSGVHARATAAQLASARYGAWTGPQTGRPVEYHASALNSDIFLFLDSVRRVSGGQSRPSQRAPPFLCLPAPRRVPVHHVMIMNASIARSCQCIGRGRS